jgi:predicted TIM-barrel fold metal-dependent hydrolase
LDRVLTPFTVEELIRHMDENDVERAVVVQRAHVYGFNNDYVADAAARFPERLVAIGMIDPLDPRAPDLVRYWVGERGLAGIRMTEAVKGSDTAWVSGPIAREVWTVATELGASVGFHFMPWNRATCLLALRDMCSRFPSTTVVVDHFSNLVGQAAAPDFGVDGLLDDLARSSGVIQKFTMINIAKLADQGLTCAPVVKRMVRAYGAKRIMWGSDVAQSKGTYAEMVRLGREATSLLTADERHHVEYQTARSLYRW